MTCDTCEKEAIYITAMPENSCLECGITRDPAIKTEIDKFIELYHISNPDAAESIMRLHTMRMVAEILVNMEIWNKIKK